MILLGIFLIMGLLIPAGAQEQPADMTRVEGIIAVVGNELILLSELNDLLAYELANIGMESPPDSLVIELRKNMLDQLIDDRLLLNYAKRRDITVEEEEVETELQNRLDMIRSRFSTESAFVAQLEAEGLTMSRFRTLQRNAVEEQLLKFRLQETLRDEWRLQVTDADIDRFCEERNDEIPDNPERVRAHHILLQLGPDPISKAREDSLLGSLKTRLDNGAAFSSLAREYSQDGSASLGGDLGRFNRGSMVPEFEAVLDTMEPGDISSIVETRFGLHLIQLIDKNEGSFQARHIIRLLEMQSDEDALFEMASEIQQRARSESLSVLAREYSADIDTRSQGGLIGIIPVSGITDETVKSVLDTISINALSDPIKQQDGIHLYWITERLAAGKPECYEIADGIRDLLFREKLESKIRELLDGLREETYIDIRL